MFFSVPDDELFQYDSFNLVSKVRIPRSPGRCVALGLTAAFTASPGAASGSSASNDTELNEFEFVTTTALFLGQQALPRFLVAYRVIPLPRVSNSDLSMPFGGMSFLPELEEEKAAKISGQAITISIHRQRVLSSSPNDGIKQNHFRIAESQWLRSAQGAFYGRSISEGEFCVDDVSLSAYFWLFFVQSSTM